MTISNFDKQLVIEQLRYIEATQTLPCNNEDPSQNLSNHHTFIDRLWQRAQCLVDQHELSSILGHAEKISYYARIIVLLIAALLGMTGILYATNDSSTINIYWLLLVLLGFNFVSMLLWLLGISLNIKSLLASVLAKMGNGLAHLLPEQKDNKSARKAANHAWLVSHYSGDIGKWQLSKITHQLWTVYLLTGFAFLVLLLMVRQYDFIWGTTLLPDSAFIQLTDILGTPLNAIGLNIPTADLVYDTRLGASQPLTIEHRYRWAQFLLGTLLCFGIAPRLLLLLWSTMMCKRARRHFALDYYLPYYVRLRQQLMPLASHGQIVDADTSPPVIAKAPALAPTTHTLPPETQWVAVELGTNLNWSPESVTTDKNLGEVIDRASLSRVLQHLQQNKCSVIAVAVDASRPPDRGMQRTISRLMSASEQCWLVLLQSQLEHTITENRLSAWYRLAESCEVPADHVISMVMA